MGVPATFSFLVRKEGFCGKLGCVPLCGGFWDEKNKRFSREFEKPLNWFCIRFNVSQWVSMAKPFFNFCSVLFC